MFQHTRTVLLTSSVSRSTSSTETNFTILPTPAQYGDLFLNVTSLTGNAATLVVAVQKGWRDLASTDGTIGVETTGTNNWIDFASFARVTTSTASQYLPLVATLTSSNAVSFSQGNIPSGTVLAGIPGDMFRVSWQVTGATPVASFSVVGKFYY